MAQHDYVIANQGFPAFRSDLNDALAAIVSNNSGATEPTTMFAHQLWVDTAANPSVLKIRNADNDAWITIGTINQTGDTFTLTSAVSATTLNTSGAVVFNDAGADVDFRVEGDTDANLLFVDAGNDRIGIGTNTPAEKLSITGSIALSGGIAFQNNQGPYWGTGQAYISYSTSTNNMSFGTNSVADRVIIDSSGNLLVGRTSTISSARFVAVRGTARDIQAVIANTSLNYGKLQFSDSVNYYIGGGQYGADWTAGSGVSMGFNVNLNATPATASLSTAGVWTNASDARYKENIVNSPYGLNEVMQLNPVQYNMIGQEQKQIGLIAQDVLPIIPEVVESTYCQPLDEDRYTLSYGNLVSVCVKAIQELKAELDTVKAELATLKGQ